MPPVFRRSVYSSLKPGEGSEIQDAVLNIVAGCSAHGEEGISIQLKNPPPHEVDHMGEDPRYPSAPPFLYRIFRQQVKVLVVPVDEQEGEGQAF